METVGAEVLIDEFDGLTMTTSVADRADALHGFSRFYYAKRFKNEPLPR